MTQRQRLLAPLVSPRVRKLKRDGHFCPANFLNEPRAPSLHRIAEHFNLLTHAWFCARELSFRTSTDSNCRWHMSHLFGAVMVVVTIALGCGCRSPACWARVFCLCASLRWVVGCRGDFAGQAGPVAGLEPQLLHRAFEAKAAFSQAAPDLFQFHPHLASILQQSGGLIMGELGNFWRHHGQQLIILHAQRSLLLGTEAQQLLDY
mmetsp:Transcript_10712/g.25299  ORF Transcript_10712/g.25299 Transcript_10712/m.25299 type:complete len:205 (-) Transcript_10712:447-1061(-)|eukprot:CAMPEP_0181464258 /NCGR_PEP_ID=MMETSP1110-20121109/35337_1 /TAXON_ID=174948 /ORGANISM="Symbiodinium sp., Strain CCMP421" /LENGTH=204 /DNA_ID=CAMNT_0023588981 /DNA_START=392 /DNA_END=1006 /DNA_ORIENTATION=-